MSYTPYEAGDPGSGDAPTPAEAINTALMAFTSCIGESLDGICSYGLTIGAEYVPFDPDEEDGCEDDEALCSQAWVRVDNVATSGSASWGGDCAVEMVLTLEVGVLRCIAIEEDGEAPTATDVMAAAFQSMDDMNSIFCAAMGCETSEGVHVFASIESGTWVPLGPLGGQYGGTWTFTATI